MAQMNSIVFDNTIQSIKYKFNIIFNVHVCAVYIT